MPPTLKPADDENAALRQRVRDLEILVWGNPADKNDEGLVGKVGKLEAFKTLFNTYKERAVGVFLVVTVIATPLGIWAAKNLSFSISLLGK